MNDLDVFSNTKIFKTENLTAIQLASSSKGNQSKWYDSKNKYYVKGQFYYQSKYWKDYLVEVIASKIAEQMYLRDVSIVKQEECLIETKEGSIHGVYSRDFSEDGSRFVSIMRLDRTAEQEILSMKSVQERWNFVLNTVKNNTGLDYTNYLIIMSLLDYLVGNEDRHLNNFGVLQKGNSFAVAPLFDFGLGLFEHDRCYEQKPFRACLDLMQCKPFSKNNQETIDFILNKYDCRDIIPDMLDLAGIEIPSPKAGSYLLNRAHNLGIELRGVS